MAFAGVFHRIASGIKDVNKIRAVGCDPPTSGGKRFLL
jgi:hypothetical protein